MARSVHDTMDIRIKGRAAETHFPETPGERSVHARTSVHQNVSVAGYGRGDSDMRMGLHGIKMCRFSWLAPATERQLLLFEIGDVGDTNFASGLLTTTVPSCQDPPPSCSRVEEPR